MSKKLDDAIAAIMAASPSQGCFASRLEGDAKELMARLREEERKGNTVGRTIAQKVLLEAFDVRISEKRIRTHLVGGCSCPS